MNRERLAWLLSLLLLALVAFRNPLAAQRDSDYRFVRTLVDIQRLVSNNYVEKTDGPKLEQAAIDGLLGQLDPFTAYIPPQERERFDRMLEGTLKGVGVQLNQTTPTGPIEIVTPIDGSPAHKAGVMAGDIILKVNGASVEGMRLTDVIKKIGGEADTQVTLTLRRDGDRILDLSMKRQEIVVPTVKGYSRKGDNSWEYFVSDKPKIAYVRLTQFTPSSFDTLHGVLKDLLKQGMYGLILDLRWNPGGQLDQAVKIVDLFITDGVIVSTRGEHRPERIETASAPGTLPQFPMIVLVNQHSASAAEIVAGSLMDNKRAAIIGERSYGKGSVQEVIPLEGNTGELKLTVAYYYLPSGRLVHRRKGAETWGVEPHIVVQMSEEADQKVAQGRVDSERFRRPGTQPGTQPATQPIDTQLQRAIDQLVLQTVFQPAANGPASRGAPATQPANDH